MRSFYFHILNNLIWIYLCAVICLAYVTMMEAIPSHVYLEEGKELSLSHRIPVEISVCDDHAETMKDIGRNTYEGFLAKKNAQDSSQLTVGSHDMMCYLFGVFPVKEMEVSVVESTNVYASGHVMGIYGETDGVFVLGSSPVECENGSYEQPAEHVLFAGDYILSVNDKAIQRKEELMDIIRKEGEDPLVLTIRRGEETIRVSVQAVRAKGSENQKESYMLGIWVKDDMAGIGTMTYYDTEGDYGALGHGIGDGETGNLLQLSKGCLYEANILGIKKGQRGNPGELQGVVYYGKENKIGTVANNTDIGIYGKLNEDYIMNGFSEKELVSLAYKQDLKTGDAYIVSDASGRLNAYHIIIDSFDYSPSDRNKGIRFHVDDENLLDLTGGIVQGLSGSPILQDGKLIGGVTHVLINDPAKGYGIFAETMLTHEK